MSQRADRRRRNGPVGGLSGVAAYAIDRRSLITAVIGTMTAMAGVSKVQAFTEQMGSTMNSRSRGLDHLVVAVRDLDAAAKFYERLGFQLGARNRHPWGTENRLIQFNGCFVELITVGTDHSAIPPHSPRHFSFGAFVRDYLKQGEGIAMLVLDSEDAAADADRFEKTGIGAFEPFFFERKGSRPDGTTVHVAFTLAFAQDPRAPLAAFFVCQHHFPENFWNPAFQQHPNGCRSITSVEMGAPDPSLHAPFLSNFTQAPAERKGSVLQFALDGCALQLVPGAKGASGLRHHALTFEVPDVAAQIERLKAEGIAFETTRNGVRISADNALGAELRFESKPSAA